MDYCPKKWTDRVKTLLLLIGIIAFSPVWAETYTIQIIKSSDNSFFNRSIENIINHIHGRVKFNITNLETHEKDKKDPSRPDLIVTLGLQAAKHGLNYEADIPVIHSYITEFQYNQNSPKDNHYSLLLDQPFKRYVHFIKHLLDVQSIAIIKTEANKLEQDDLLSISAVTGLHIDQYIFEQGDNPINSVRNVLRQNDVLLTLPESDVYNRNTLKGILLASYRLDKPVVSYSPSHVKSGALAAIYTSPENIGKQLASMINKMIENKRYKPPIRSYAQDFNIVFNQRVADSLNIKLPDKQTLRQQLTGDVK